MSWLSLKRHNHKASDTTQTVLQATLMCNHNGKQQLNPWSCWTPHITLKHHSHNIITLTILLRRTLSWQTDLEKLLTLVKNTLRLLRNRSQAQVGAQEFVTAVGGWRWQRYKQDSGSLGAAGHWAQLLLTHTLFWKVLKGLAGVNNIPTLCVCWSYFGLLGGRGVWEVLKRGSFLSGFCGLILNPVKLCSAALGLLGLLCCGLRMGLCNLTGCWVNPHITSRSTYV